MGGDWGRRAVRRRFALLLDNVMREENTVCNFFFIFARFRSPGSHVVVCFVCVGFDFFLLFFFFSR